MQKIKQNTSFTLNANQFDHLLTVHDDIKSGNYSINIHNVEFYILNLEDVKILKQYLTWIENDIATRNINSLRFNN